MPPQMDKLPNIKSKDLKKGETSTIVIQATGGGEESRDEAFSALVAQGFTPRDAYLQLYPNDKSLKPGTLAGRITRMTNRCQEKIDTIKRLAMDGKDQLQGISLSWILQELRLMYETPLSEIGPDSRFCREYEKKVVMTDAGPIETKKVKKDSPHDILKTIANLAGVALPSQGTAAALALEERRTKVEESKAGTLESFLAGLVDHGPPFMRKQGQGKVIDVEEGKE